MKHALRYLLPLVAITASAAEKKVDPFADIVRPTEPLTPDQERASFTVPPGFEVQLVAAEPDLRKPMNMAWDSLGRLWITESREYPFPVRDFSAPMRDTVRVLSDFGPDGRARKVEVFADGLNIPIGLYPFRSPGEGGKITQKCIVWSIPNIWLMEDVDGDGKADKRTPLFGPLGWEKDTHGNIASFRRGNDGWLYGTHGFNNHSIFKATDGSSIELTSGNTWRIHLDGSRVEQYTFGQVNPFGLCWDERGNLYSADCHSSPLYQLLRGGYYPSFGKPHDGLGFAPVTILHSHGSTAICAPVVVQDPSWPAELQNHFFLGNVMTSRLNHDAVTWNGASSKGKEMPDFLTTTDPWFRPMDLEWGPDGALYVADFYNRIIGHYEVPLTHPGRDRERGRIWRIVYRGADGKGQLPATALPPDAAGLVKELGSTNPTRRSLALNDLCDRIGKEAIPALQANVGLSAQAGPEPGFRRMGALWALQRLGGLDEKALLDALWDTNMVVRTHALRIADARPTWSAELAKTVRSFLKDPDAIVRRVAGEALGSHPSAENIGLLVTALNSAARDDDHLIYGLRVAIRDNLRVPEVAAKVTLDGLSAQDLRTMLDIMVAVPGEHTALLRLGLLEKVDLPAAELAKQLPSIAREIPYDHLERVAGLARRKLSDDLTTQAALLTHIVGALDQRGAKPGPILTEWAGAIVPQLLVSNAKPTWASTGTGPSPWGTQVRKSADGQDAPVISSFPHGEPLTGVLRSAPFALPEKLRFYLCGHDGPPGGPVGKKNFVRLIDAADGKVLREAAPPRNDVAQRIEWDLAEFAGHRGYFEATDGDTGKAYAWLAFGRFKPELPELAMEEPGLNSQRRQLGVELAGRFRLAENVARIGGLLADAASDNDTRAAAASALLKLALPDGVKQTVAVLRSAPTSLQTVLARTLASTPEGSGALLTAFTDGQASLGLLRDPALINALKATAPAGGTDTLAKLTAKLPPANAELDKLIADRRTAFASGKGDISKGAQVFQNNCAVCHRLGTVGNLVGPQLDGVGSRGADRIIEDVLDPNRNVDRAFRLSLITLKDGTVASGLIRREEGKQLVLADFTGKETTVPLAQITKREESETSLMPPAFGQIIPVADFNDLVAFLVSQRPK